MNKIISDLDPFFWMVAVMIAGITVVDVADLEFVSPYSTFVQAMVEPTDLSQ